MYHTFKTTSVCSDIHCSRSNRLLHSMAHDVTLKFSAVGEGPATELAGKRLDIAGQLAALQECAGIYTTQTNGKKISDKKKLHKENC